MSGLAIAVLLGGTSEERRVSLASGREIVKALRSRGHEVLAVDPAIGTILEDEEERYLGGAVGTEPPSLDELRDAGRVALGAALADVAALRDADVVFLALHGGDGENGCVQALLDLAGIRYTGSGVIGSVLAFDKRISKELLRAAGVSTPDWAPIGAGPGAIVSELGLPLVVKPSGGGSTVGLSVVREAAELDGAIRLAESYGDALCEAFIDGRELTVTVLDGRALPVVEIIPGNEIYDYESKYTPGKSTYLVPADLEPEVAAELARVSEVAYRALRQDSYSRIDFRLDAEGTPWCLEANSLPGMTATSLVPKAARAAGIEFPELCERLVMSALEAGGD